MDPTWPYSADYDPAAPVVRLVLLGVQIECLVDTGFSGGVLVPLPTFESLGLLSRLVPDAYQAVMPDGRRLPLYTAKGQVGVGTASIQTEIQSSPALRRWLVGRGFLKAFVAVLDGKQKLLTLT